MSYADCTPAVNHVSYPIVKFKMTYTPNLAIILKIVNSDWFCFIPVTGALDAKT